MSSKESGLIRATNSISQMIATFPMSYFGGKGRKPRYLGIGIFSLGIGKSEDVEIQLGMSYN